MLIHSAEKIAPRPPLQDSFEAIAGSGALASAHQENREGKPLSANIRSVEVTYEDIQKIQQDGTVVLVRNMVDPQRPTWHYPPALARAFADVFRLNAPSSGA